MERKVGTVELRENNTNLIRKALLGMDTATKAVLAAATGLSVATCGKILAAMVTSGEAVALELAAPDGGRPPRLYAYNPMYSLSALVFPKTQDGESFIVHAIRDAKGGVVEKGVLPVGRADMGTMQDLIDGWRRRYPSIRAVAISIPGLVRDGVVGFCDLPELAGVDVRAALDIESGIAVSMDNDMNLAALGYFRSEMRAGSVVYMVVPRKNCTGAGFVVDGKVLVGATRFAGELSFMPFGVGRETQFAGLPKDKAMAYTATLAAAVIPVINPSRLVIASEMLDARALEGIRRTCAEHIPEEHLPEFVAKPSLDDDCLEGLAAMAAMSIARTHSSLTAEE